MNFYEFVGQKEIITGLKHALLEDRVGHASLFTGPKGIGKKTLAAIFAARLLCVNSSTEERCGTCPACSLIEHHGNPDFQVVGEGEDGIGVEEIRKLQGDILVKPLYSARKVYLIPDADRMTPQAQNCLLKILEEPPRHAVFILTTANSNALLETVRSRTVKYSFRKNTFEEVGGYLEKQLGKDHPGLDFVISYADGIIGVAMELLQTEGFAAMRDQAARLVVELAKGELLDVFEWYGFFEANKSRVDMIFDMLLLFYRDLLMLSKTGNEKLLINSDKKDIIVGNVSRFSAGKLADNIECIERTRLNIKQNANYQLAIEVMLMKIQEEPFKW